MTDNRTGVPLITEILDVLDRHGYTPSDTAHTARTILLISDLAHIYEGYLDHPFGPYIGEIPSRTEPAPPGSAGPDAVLIPAGQVKNLLVALDIAATTSAIAPSSAPTALANPARIASGACTTPRPMTTLPLSSSNLPGPRQVG